MADLEGVRSNPFFASNHPESPGNGVSDVSDFKIFLGEHAPEPP